MSAAVGVGLDVPAAVGVGLDVPAQVVLLILRPSLAYITHTAFLVKSSTSLHEVESRKSRLNCQSKFLYGTKCNYPQRPAVPSEVTGEAEEIAGFLRISLCTDLLMRKKLRVYPKFRF